jgi:hypothetical protein
VGHSQGVRDDLLNAQFCRQLWKDRGSRPRIAAEDFHRLLNGLATQLAKESLLDPRLDAKDTAKRLFHFLFSAAS